MPFDAFMNIDGINGESTDEKHCGWIELIRFGVEVNQPTSKTTSSAGGAGTERAVFSNFIVRKLLDISSPKLALACADGTHINQIVIELCRAGKEKVPFMTYTLNNCIISRFVTTNGSDVPGAFPAETVHINYGKIVWCYSRQSRQNGGLLGKIATGWDLQLNCRI